MAVSTQVVCDACGLGKVGTRGEPEQLNLEMTGLQPISIELDVHRSPRCIIRAVKTALEQHFNVNGATK